MFWINAIFVYALRKYFSFKKAKATLQNLYLANRLLQKEIFIDSNTNNCIYVLNNSWFISIRLKAAYDLSEFFRRILKPLSWSFRDGSRSASPSAFRNHRQPAEMGKLLYRLILRALEMYKFLVYLTKIAQNQFTIEMSCLYSKTIVKQFQLLIDF